MKSFIAVALFAMVAAAHAGVLGPVVVLPQSYAVANPGALGLDIGLGASSAGLGVAGIRGPGWGRPCCGIGASFGGAITGPGLALGGGVRGGISPFGAGIQAGLGLVG